MDPKEIVSEEDGSYFEGQFERMIKLWDELFVQGELATPTSVLRDLDLPQRQLLLLLMLKLWPEKWEFHEKVKEHDRKWLITQMTESLNGRGRYPLDARGLWAHLTNHLQRTTSRLSES